MFGRWPGLVAVLSLSFLTAASSSLALEVPFRPRVVVDDTVNNPRTAIAADIDGDGDEDIIAAVLADNRFYWYENDGVIYPESPSFTRHELPANARGAREVWTADINRDGRLDILGASRADNSIRWFRNDGGSPATFTEFVVTDDVFSAWSVYATDIDGDGDLDILSAGRDDDRISWHENDGAPTPSWTKHVIDTDARRAQKVFADDVDGDGDMDMLSASGAGDEIAWYENDGTADPSFTKHSLTTSMNNAKWVWTGDLDGDGDVDILGAAESEPSVEWFENDGADDPSFTRRRIATVTGAKTCQPVDIDSDGDLDVLSNGIGLDEILIHENLGGDPLEWDTYTVSTESDNPLTTFPADLNGDSRLDIICASFEDNTIGWYENRWLRVSRALEDPITLDVGDESYVSIIPVDLDGDGVKDFALCTETGNVSWRRLVDGTIEAFSVADVGPGGRIATADFNGDSRADLAMSNSAGAVTLLLSDEQSPTGFILRTVAVGLDPISGIAAGDLDADADADITLASTTGALYVLENDGADLPSFSTLTVGSGADGATELRIVDLNSDGAVDVVASVADRDRVVAYLSDSGVDPAFTQKDMPDVVQSPGDMAVADLNNDGSLDVVVASTTGPITSVMLNDGEEDVTLTGYVIGGAEVSALALADFRRDGYDDLLLYSMQTNSFGAGEGFAGDFPIFLVNPLGGSEPIAGVSDFHILDYDRNGTLDVVGVTAQDEESVFFVIPNRASQISVIAQSIARPDALIGRDEPLLVVEASSGGGRSDDTAALGSLALRFTDSAGAALSSAELSAIIDEILIYADSDNSGALERLGDELLVEVGEIELDADGLVTVEVDTANSENVIYAGATRSYFVAVHLRPDADTAVPNQFQASLQPARDGDFVQRPSMAPLRVVSTPEVSTPVITATEPEPGQVLLGEPWLRHTIDNSLLGAEGPRAADVNGDGLTDYAVAWEQSGFALLYLHPSPDLVREPWPSVVVGFAPNGETAAPVDLNNDGRFEIITAISAGPRTIRANLAPEDPTELLNPDAWTTENFTQTPTDLWVYVEPADIDGENGLDLVIGSIGRQGNFEAQLGWLRCPSDPMDFGAWTYHKITDLRWTMSIVAQDIDHDGDLDVVYSNRFGNNMESGVFWAENPGSGSPDLTEPWTTYAVGELGRETMFIDVADLDSDGLADVIVPSRPGQLFVNYAADTSGRTWFIEELPWPEDLGIAKSARVGDINLDGGDDIVLSAVEAGEIEALSGLAWLRRPSAYPNGDWQAYEIAGFDGEKFDIVQLDDVDQDGDMDIVAAEERNNSQTAPGLGVVWYENPLIQLTGDVNRDRVTDSTDLAQLISAWGEKGALLPEDLTGDGVVDSADLATLLSAFGRSW
jgi:hypothetical protein